MYIWNNDKIQLCTKSLDCTILMTMANSTTQHTRVCYIYSKVVLRSVVLDFSWTIPKWNGSYKHRNNTKNDDDDYGWVHTHSSSRTRFTIWMMAYTAHKSHELSRMLPSTQAKQNGIDKFVLEMASRHFILYCCSPATSLSYSVLSSLLFFGKMFSIPLTFILIVYL